MMITRRPATCRTPTVIPISEEKLVGVSSTGGGKAERHLSRKLTVNRVACPQSKGGIHTDGIGVIVEGQNNAQGNRGGLEGNRSYQYAQHVCIEHKLLLSEPLHLQKLRS